MARKRKKTREEGAAAAPERAAGGQPKEKRAAGDAAADRESNIHARHVALALMLIVFVLFEVITWSLFKSGEQIQWKKELSNIEQVFESGNYERAAKRLTEFGKDWPGARETVNWNRQMGLYHAKAGNWEVAAKHYEKASEIAPERPKLHALAGEAFWKAGNREKALDALQAEVNEINPALGDHDRANYYLGLVMLEQDRLQEAFQHFQAIKDREEWKDELEDAYARVEEDFLEPAREKAREMEVEELAKSQ